MVIVQVIMFIIIVLSSYWAYYFTGMTTGLVALVGPTLAWFAGAGLKGALRSSALSEQLGGTILTLMFAFAAYWMIHYTGFHISHMGISLDGEWWALICFIIGMLGWQHRYRL
jgi:Mg2+/Co2+ transporter CorB